MARRDEQKTKSSGNIHNKVQGFVFGINLEGSEEVVTEGIKAFTHAMTKSGLVLAATVVAKPTLLAAKPESPESSTDLCEPESEASQPLDEEFDCQTEGNGSGAAKPKKPRKFPRPTFLKDLNLTQAGLPLADFMKQKSPQDMMDKYAVVSVWLKEQFGVEEVSIDHIFTAFKHLGWESQLPADVGKPLSNLVHSRHWFEKGKGEKTFAIVWLGESEVAKMGTPGADK